MSDWGVLDIVLYGTGAVIALVQSAVFAHYHGLFRHDYLRFWSLSFLALAIYLATAGTSIVLQARFPASHPLRLLLSSLSLGAAYVQIALLVIGTLTIWRNRAPARASIVQALTLAVALGLLSVFAFAFDPSAAQERMLLRVGLRYLLTGVAGVALGVAILRHWGWNRFGSRLTAIALIVYGLDLLHVFGAYVAQASGQPPWSWLRYTSVPGAVTQLFIGFGLVIWLLEDERERAERATDAAAHLRHFDPLTGLPNRHNLLQHIDHQIKAGQSTSLLLVRVDNLGTVAAAFGMDGVDLALTTAAERIEEVARTRGLLAARPDSDHFALHGTGFGIEAGAGRIAEEVLDLLSRPLFWNGREIALEASIGIASTPTNSAAADQLYSCAEKARARSQREGAMRYRFFSLDIDTEIEQRLLLQSELRNAFARGEFILEFQPILGGWDLEICGFEALVRWQHPTCGRLLPDAFINEFEPLGMIEALDAWVLEHACRSALAWQKPGRDPIPVAVNISAHSFQRRDFPDVLAALLQRIGLAPSCLELEIVESIALELPERAIVSLDRLRDIGVRVVLDDFGTGFSSLKHLRQLPFDGIKIDRSFVVDVLVDPRDAAIVRAMLALAHSLGLDVVAEGIETAAQLAWFQSAGSDRLQGFHFHQSMEQTAAVALVNQSSAPVGASAL
ncbi:MAG TPA: bifunctional diguanylate cyclase/phosphodiesterase [Dokdonella sp.]|uniref:putative bifunctional diguanylate cyclase/phosphodiesterase n=1 Tax=Dokdonella sp. TaxID=2291710 RepID=UPI0025C4521F|nr:bifunctional diguanylate cyclase/phosphodiesterase [Dokdonella sp.]MBX3693503.1 bifunctional diguanylate cyclase/phosphodiesterase [Dokdonella sp.]HNR91204.1 bifunctional diguanylate cyclase/phosphodiesterase [Dokdonella sp.]